MAEATRYTTLRQTYALGKVVADDYVRDYKHSLLLYAVAHTAQGLAYLCLYLVMVALFASPVDAAGAWSAFALMVSLLVVNSTARWFAHDFDYTDTLADVTHNMRVKLGHKLRSMPLEQLSRYKTGDINSSLSSNVEESVTMLGMVSGMFIETVLTPAVVIAGLFFIDWRMALVMLVILPLAVPLYRRKRSSGMREKTEMTLANSALESDIIEYIQGLPVLRAINQTGQNAARLRAGILGVQDLQRSSLWGTILNLVLVDLLIVFALVISAILGSFWVGQGTMSVAVVASVLVIVARLMEPLSLFLAMTSVIDLMSSGFARVKAILDTEPLEVRAPEGIADRFDIQLHDVKFTYAEHDRPAIDGVSCSIPTRAMTAIVGPSGSGKTTLTKLMMRFADPQQGRIEIGGVDIRRMTQEALLKCFSVVFQDVYLFDESILENIRMAKSDATDAEVVQAAKAAHCHEFVERLPRGYQTVVGDIGGSLSGGERQRISIARAILKDAPIVILDEPTAALDTESELAVQQAIDALVEDKTIIVIAHRLSTVAGADQILVIDEGRLVEQGTHASLLEQGGRYHGMWQAQLRSKAWRIGA